MGGCFSKPKPVELKIEVVLPEKERGKEELLAGGKGSPRAYQGNGTARHFHADERLPAPHPYPSAQDCVEAAVCHVKDLENGQMREVELGWGKVLLVKDNGEFHALGHKCPHYGAPLVKGELSQDTREVGRDLPEGCLGPPWTLRVSSISGVSWAVGKSQQLLGHRREGLLLVAPAQHHPPPGVLSRGRVRCPWHGACFNISTGDLEDFPGLDSLHKFQVKIEKEKVYVRASKQVRVWLGAQAKGRSEGSILAQGSACAKALWLGNRVKGYMVGMRLDCSGRTWPAGMMAQGGCPRLQLPAAFHSPATPRPCSYSEEPR